MKPGDLARVIVDTTVQPKNIAFPTDAKLLKRLLAVICVWFGVWCYAQVTTMAVLHSTMR
jgi:hypothetical protein